MRQRRAREADGPDWRPRVDAESFVEALAGHAVIDVEALRSRARTAAVALGRELVAVVAVERFGVKVKDLAEKLCKSPGGISRTLRRGIRRRLEDDPFSSELDSLDRFVLQSVTAE